MTGFRQREANMGSRRRTAGVIFAFVTATAGPWGCGDDRSSARTDAATLIREELEVHKEPEKALQAASEAARADPESAVLQYWLGRCYLARNRLGDALK